MYDSILKNGDKMDKFLTNSGRGEGENRVECLNDNCR